MNVTPLKLILPRMNQKPPIRGFYTRWEAYRRSWAYRVLEFSPGWRAYEGSRHDWTIAKVCHLCGLPEWIDCPVNFCPVPGNRIIAEMKREADELSEDVPRCIDCGQRTSSTWYGQPVCPACKKAQLPTTYYSTLPDEEIEALESWGDLHPSPCIDCGQRTWGTWYGQPMCTDCQNRRDRLNHNGGTIA